MYYLRVLMLLFSLTGFLFMVIGLFKPWVMLWWEDMQHRKKVLQVYGTTGVVFLLIYFVMGWMV